MFISVSWCGQASTFPALGGGGGGRQSINLRRGCRFGMEGQESFFFDRLRRLFIRSSS